MPIDDALGREQLEKQNRVYRIAAAAIAAHKSGALDLAQFCIGHFENSRCINAEEEAPYNAADDAIQRIIDEIGGKDA
jgi:hypothetical protein